MSTASRVASWIGTAAILIAVAGGLWCTGRGSPDAQTSQVAPQRASTAVAAAADTASAVTDAPARLTVTVVDDKGPIAGAAVRLAPDDGEVIVIETGRDGVARADRLGPGAWRISASAAGHVPAALPATRLAAGADEQRVIKLAAGGRALTGTVSDATGGPIAGARIDAARLTSRGQPGGAIATVLTGRDGSYRMTVAEGPLLVAAASADYAPQSRYIDVGPAGAVADFALIPGGAIDGVVLDERTRQPVAGASVTARRDSPVLLAEAGAHRTISDASGRFRVAGLRPGAWDVAASAQDRHSRAQTVIGLGVAEQIGDVELLIGAGPVIRGRVVDETGATVAGAVVIARNRRDLARATSDAAGAFVLEGLAPGSYGLTAGEPHVPAGVTRVALADKDADGVVVRVARGVVLHGHVEPRQPCSIQVEIEPRPGMLGPPAGTASGPDGGFEIGPLATGSVALEARCDSGDQGRIKVAVAPAAPEIVLEVAPGGSIAGRVVDGTGTPVAGTGVMASEISRGEHTMVRNGMVTSGLHAMTDASGAYRIDGLAQGSYRVTALERGKPLAPRTPPPIVELAINEHETGVDLVIDRADGVIRGTVTGPDGSPLADAWVSAYQDLASMLDGMRGSGRPGGGPESRTMVVEGGGGGAGGDTGVPPVLTDARGHYELRGLLRGSHAVVAEAQRGQLRARATGVTPDATVDLKAMGVTSLSGTVTGPGGRPALFSIELEGPTRTQRSFTDGTYSFARVDPGSYTIKAQASEGNAQATVTITAGQPATLDLTLAANAIVVGTLVDPTGAPVPDQSVALVADSGGDRLEVRVEGAPPVTGPDGRFRLEHRPGRYALLVMRPQPFTRRGLVLEAGKTLDVGAITLEPAGPGPGPGPGPGSAPGAP